MKNQKTERPQQLSVSIAQSTYPNADSRQNVEWYSTSVEIRSYSSPHKCTTTKKGKGPKLFVLLISPNEGSGSRKTKTFGIYRYFADSSYETRCIDKAFKRFVLLIILISPNKEPERKRTKIIAQSKRR